MRRTDLLYPSSELDLEKESLKLAKKIDLKKKLLLKLLHILLHRLLKLKRILLKSYS